jgi:hypothetical protein
MWEVNSHHWARSTGLPIGGEIYVLPDSDSHRQSGIFEYSKQGTSRHTGGGSAVRK